MKLKSKTKDSFGSIFVTGLLHTLKWTTVYYVGMWASLMGLGLVALGVEYLKNRKAKK